MTILRMIVAASAILMLSSLAMADKVAEPQQVIFKIESQPLESALNEFGRQAGYQLLFQSAVVLKQTAPSVNGALTPEAALKALLANSGLSYKFVNPRTVTISAANENVSAFKIEELNLAQVDQASSSMQKMDPSSVQSTSLSGDGRGTEGEESQAIPEILVKGSRSLNADIERSRDDIQPYIILNREAIERSGATDVGELLRKNLAANVSTVTYGTGPSAQGNATDISLRGLGSGQTLILIDGRRAASYSIGGALFQPDLNSIPLSAIERIEILPVSASGIYGGSATGGVVNVVLKHDYSGIETSLTYNNTFHSNSAISRFGFTGGRAMNGGKTSILLSGSYSDSDPLLARDRDFYTKGRQAILANNPATYFSTNTPPLGRTSNISSIGVFDFAYFQQTGQVRFTKPPLVLKNGQSLGSPITHVPDGYAGTSDGGAALIAQAGTYNFDSADTAQNEGGGRESLITASIVKSLRATLRHEFTSSFTGFIELSGTGNSGEYMTNQTTPTFTIRSTAPNNPFSQDITVTTPGFGPDLVSGSRLDDRKGVLGAIFRLPWGGWQSSIDYTIEQTELANTAVAAGISAAGNAAVTGGAIDILKDTNVYRIDLSQYQNGLAIISPVKTTLNDAVLRVGGGVFSLPAGNVDLSLLTERSRQKLDNYLVQLTALNASVIAPARVQTVNSAYAELRIPLVSNANSLPGLRLLELQAAGRFDDYTSEGANQITVIGGVQNGSIARATSKFHSLVPTFGLRIAPFTDFMIRASYAEGFVPPGLTNLVPSPDLFLPTGSPTLRDPRRGNTPINTPINMLRGGNPNLGPETSISKSLGVVITPRLVEGLRLSWDWSKIDKKDNLGSLSLNQTDLANELFAPGFITRAPPQNDGFDVGPITVVDARTRNLARMSVETYDWSVDYKLDTDRLGAFLVGGSASQFIHFNRQATPTSPLSVLEDIYIAPRWSANAYLTWRWRNVTTHWATQYLGSYWYQQDHSVSPNYARAKAPSASYHDFSASYRFERATVSPGRSLLAGAEVVLGINNVFNTPPRLMLDSTNIGLFDTRVDPRLATYYVTLRKSFGGDN